MRLGFRRFGTHTLLEAATTSDSGARCHLVAAPGLCHPFFFLKPSPARLARHFTHTSTYHDVRCPLHLRRRRQRRGHPPRRRQEVQPSCRARRAQGARRQGSLLGPGQLLLPVPRRRGRPVPRHPPPLHGLLQRGWRGVRCVPPRLGCPRLLRRRRYVRARATSRTFEISARKRKISPRHPPARGRAPRAPELDSAETDRADPSSPHPISALRARGHHRQGQEGRRRRGWCVSLHPFSDDDQRDPNPNTSVSHPNRSTVQTSRWASV